MRALELPLTPEQRSSFPVDWIFVAVLEQANGVANEDYYAEIFIKLM